MQGKWYVEVYLCVSTVGWDLEDVMMIDTADWNVTMGGLQVVLFFHALPVTPRTNRPYTVQRKRHSEALEAVKIWSPVLARINLKTHVTVNDTLVLAVCTEI